MKDPFDYIEPLYIDLTMKDGSDLEYLPMDWRIGKPFYMVLPEERARYAELEKERNASKWQLISAILWFITILLIAALHWV